MANRVNVNVNVNDHSRAGLAALRRNMRQMQRDARRAGGNINFNVNVDPGTSRADLRRIQRSMRGRPVTINTRLDPPSPPPQTFRRRLQQRLGRITIPVRVPTRHLVNQVRGGMRTAGAVGGGILSDGIGQGVISGFQAAGPIGMAVLAATILGAISVVGAALSGLLVTALGLAFVGIGGVSAAMSDRVKEQWSDTLGVLKKEFEDVGKPLIPVLDRALERLGRMAEEAGPALRKAIEETAPATEMFINRLMDGFESFGEAAFGPIMDAWNVFAPVFGDEWDEFMGELGESFADMADLVREHPTEIAMALGVVFEAIELLVDTVTFFGKVWVFSLQTALDAAGAFGEAIQFMGTMALDMFGGIINGAASAFGWMPGIGPKLKEAAGSFNTFREQAVEKLEGIGSAANDMKEALNRANEKRQLDADISTWQHKLEIARADLKKTTSQKAKAKVQANIDNLVNNIAAARAKLNALNGKVVTTYVDTWQRNRGYAGNSVTGGRAMGGVIGTAATGGVRSNMTLVGEAGPEIVNLSPGSRVRSNPDTRRVLGGSRPNADRARLVIDAGSTDLDRLLVKILRQSIRDQGGNVQAVLGGTGR